MYQGQLRQLLSNWHLVKHMTDSILSCFFLRVIRFYEFSFKLIFKIVLTEIYKRLSHENRLSRACYALYIRYASTYIKTYILQWIWESGSKLYFYQTKLIICTELEFDFQLNNLFVWTITNYCQGKYCRLCR